MTEELQNVQPYTERSGTNAAGYVEILLSPPEIKLTDEEKARAKEFAHGLFNGKFFEALDCGSKLNLEEIYQMSPLEDIVTFYPGYFESPEGMLKLQELGVASSKSYRDLLTSPHIIQAAGLKNLKAVGAKSLGWYKDYLANALAGNDQDLANFSDPEQLSINYNPMRLLDKIEALQSYRRFYREVRGDIKNDNSNLGIAIQTLLNVYRAKVNNQLAALYDAAFNLAEQYSQPKNPDEDAILERLKKTMPMTKKAVEQENQEDETRLDNYTSILAMRLDFIRHGAAWNKDKTLGPISPELADLVLQLEKQTQAEQPVAPQISEDLIAKFEETKWNAEQLAALAEDVIASWGLLSEHRSTWQEVQDRNGFALDGKWQVIITPQKNAMQVAGEKRVMYVPAKFNRNLVNELPAGVIPLLSHELFHLAQCEYDYIRAEDNPLTKIQGRRASSVREFGTVEEERKIQAMMGRSRKTNLHYLNGLRVKIEGGSKIEVSKAFYDSATKGKELSDEEAKEARELAVDRSLRFYSQGGYNTFPLDYIQRELIGQALAPLTDQQRHAFLIAGASFDLMDSAALHRVDLFEMPEEVIYHPAEAVWQVFQAKYLPGIQ